MNRRNFLKKSFLSAAALSYWSSGVPFQFAPRNANAATPKTLVKIFLRGGMDGLNTIIPHGDESYYKLRPTIGIPKNGQDALFDLNGFFGMHPSLSDLFDLFNMGNVALFPATHYPSGSRSHFNSQELIERTQSNEGTSGWLNRLLEYELGTDLPAVGLGYKLPKSLRGPIPVSAINDLERVGLGVDKNNEDELLSALNKVYSHSLETEKSQNLFNKFGQKMLRDQEILSSIDTSTAETQNNAQYPNSTFAKRLSTVATLVKANVGLRIANVDLGGWDFHADQGASQGKHANSLAQLSQGIGEFCKDLGSSLNDTVIVIGTEFGRTVAENGSKGTDHGAASSWIVIGGEVNGGIYGDWPGLANHELEDGRYLKMATDYRDIYANIIKYTNPDAEISKVIPDFIHSELGLF